MSTPDLNLLLTLDALLSEGSVVGAARRLRLSASAMSRALARVREVTGDPLLVRAGRGLVPTPRAQALRAQAARLVQEAVDVLRPAEAPDLATVEREFTIRASDGFVENFGAALIGRIAKEAPGVRLRFVQKAGRDNAPLRDGLVDLETGVVAASTSPELMALALFQDRFVGVVCRDHALAGGRITRARYAAAGHVAVSRRVRGATPLDDALTAAGVERRVVTTVSGFATALALARATDLVATVPERHTANLRAGMHAFPLPFPSPGITVSMLWHPRMHADPAHRWLRACVREVCGDPEKAARRPRSERGPQIRHQGASPRLDRAPRTPMR